MLSAPARISRLLACRTIMVLWGAVLANAATCPALAADCELEGQGEGQVVAIIDARTFRLDDGREIRLSGIETAATRKAEGVGALKNLIADRRVVLRGESDSPDRYGRQH